MKRTPSSMDSRSRNRRQNPQTNPNGTQGGPRSGGYDEQDLQPYSETIVDQTAGIGVQFVPRSYNNTFGSAPSLSIPPGQGLTQASSSLPDDLEGLQWQSLPYVPGPVQYDNFITFGSQNVPPNTGQFGEQYMVGYGQDTTTGQYYDESVSLPPVEHSDILGSSNVLNPPNNITDIRTFLPNDQAGPTFGSRLRPKPSVQGSSATSTETSRTCPICEMQFKRKADMKRHRKQIHEGEKRTFSCSQCAMLFHWDKDLRRHMETHVAINPTYLCNQGNCQETVRRTDNFRRHMKKKHGLDVVCCSVRGCASYAENKSKDELKEDHKQGLH